MITVDNKEYRNLEEQVLQNKNDISYLLKEGGTLNEFGLKVVGEVATQDELPDPKTYTGEFGDAFVVGMASPFEFFVYTRAFSGQQDPFWFNIGQFPLPGPIGPVGPQGEPGPVGRGSQWTTGNAEPTADLPVGDMYLQAQTGNVYRKNANSWELVANIKGAQGVPGPQGIQGPTGPRGIQGPAGPVGPAGDPFTIVGTLTSTAQLPAPTSVSRATAYLVTEDNVNYLYVISGEEGNLLWTNTGPFGGGSSVYEKGAFVQRFNVDNINNEIVALQNLVDNNTDATTELTSRMANIEDSAAQKDASNLTAQEINLWQRVLGVIDKASIDASNLSSDDVQSWKDKLKSYSFETVYDKSSSDSAINWGYTSGIQNATKITGKNFSKYKKLIFTFIGAWDGFTLIMDLTHAGSDNSYWAQVGGLHRSNSTYWETRGVMAMVPSAKTSLEIYTAANGKDVTNIKCVLIEGAY